MKTKNMYLNRLLKLAEALHTLDSNKHYRAGENGISVTHFYWALDLLSDKWQNKESDNNSASELRKFEVLYKAAVYFKLTADEVFHLFGVGYHEEFFGGRRLTEKATPAQLAQNIVEFVQIKDSDLSETADDWRIGTKEKQCKIIKLKNNYHEEKQYANYMS